MKRLGVWCFHLTNHAGDMRISVFDLLIDTYDIKRGMVSLCVAADERHHRHLCQLAKDSISFGFMLA